MAVFDLLAIINLKSSCEKATSWLIDRNYDCIFLPLPVIIERYIKSGLERCKNGLDREVLLKQRILREPEDAQLIRAMEPLFKYIYNLYKKGVEIHCYKADLDWSFSHDFATQFLLLTLRSKLQGIKVEEWLKLLEEEAIFIEETLYRDAYLLSAKARATNACITTYGAEELKISLEKIGHKVELIKLDTSATPLDKLRAEVKRKLKYGEEVSRELAEKLIAMHLKFTDLILEKGYEEAYQNWLKMEKSSNLV
ncbi:MAG: hypothetical protein QXJ68_06795 [Methanocellales archaeon]